MTADAGTLHAVTIRSRAAATGADSTGSASLMTEPITAPHALIEATTCRAASEGCSAKVANYRFTTMPPGYKLTTLLSRTLTYELGRSGIARRDKHGQHFSTVPFTAV